MRLLHINIVLMLVLNHVGIVLTMCNWPHVLLVLHHYVTVLLVLLRLLHH